MANSSCKIDRYSLDLESLKSQIKYESDTGVFTWIISRKGVSKGKSAGVIDKKSGYLAIGLNRHIYLGHRLAWFYVHGIWPKFIDHIDRDRGNNRICNLRECDQLENAWNTSISKLNSSGVKGVYWNKDSKRWHAQGSLNRKRINLGFFQDIDEAREAYEKFCSENHGDYFYKLSNNRGMNGE